MQLRIKWEASGVIAGVLLAAMAFLASRNIFHDAPAASALDASAVVHEIQSLNGLVSVKYTVQKGGWTGREESPARIGEAAVVRTSRSLGGDRSIQPHSPRCQAASRPESQIALPPPKIVHIVIDDKATKV